MITK
jgi:hypothetical protein